MEISRKFKNNNKEDWKTRVPQGSILSPTLFNIYISGLPKITNDNKITIMQYADDIAILVQDRNMDTIKGKIIRMIRTIKEFLENRNLTLSTQKTKIVPFGINHKDNRWIELKDNVTKKTERLAMVQSAKFLGLEFDENLNFRTHVLQIAARAKKRTTVLRYLCKKEKGMSATWGLRIYKSMIAPIMEYGAFIYLRGNEGINTQKDWDPLRKIESQAMRIIMGYRQSTPINVISAESGIWNIKQRAQLLAERY